MKRATETLYHKNNDLLTLTKNVTTLRGNSTAYKGLIPLGAPLGNQNARKRHWSTAIEAAVMQEDERTKKRRLHIIAERLIAKAEEGDIQAIKEIGDRLDGKPAQAITGPDGGPLTVNVVKQVTQDDEP